MSFERPLTILVIASYEKGNDFIKECKKQGCRVFLLTSKSLENAPWPHESLDDIFYFPDHNKEWNMTELINAVSYLARERKLDRIVAMDDYDVEKAATLREHLRIPGMGETTARYFRDKLAMRMRAREEGILVPDFVHILNNDDINQFMQKLEAPYIIKPRLHAGAIGVKKIHNPEELWKLVDGFGDQRSFYLMEKFVPGDIYHVDSIVFEKEIIFSLVSKYGKPPMEVAHEGRVFSTITIPRGNKEDKSLKAMNSKVLKAMGLVKGISHTEFIKAHEDGKFYFLETSARVGGANISELVKAATGLNLWEEWAKLETLNKGEEYKLPKFRNDYAGLILSLAKEKWPDLSTYNDEEICWKLKKKFHAGLIVRSGSHERVQELTDKYINRFYKDYFATQPMPDRPTD